MPQRITFVLIILALAFMQAIPASAKRKPHHPASKHTAIRPSKERRDVQSQLAQLREEIRKTEADLREHEHRERRTKESVAAYDKQTRALKSQLSTLHLQANELQSQLSDLNTSFAVTTESISTLKQGYANDVTKRYVTGVYRASPQEGTLLADPNETLDRERRAYMGRIASQAFNKNGNILDSTKTVLTENIADVSASLQEEQQHISQTNKEAITAQTQKQKEAQELKSIQTKKAALQIELDRRKADARKLEGIISNLIAREEAERKAREEERKKRLAELKKKKAQGKKLTQREVKQEKEDAHPAELLPGPRSLSWPCGSHKIVQGFGEVRNPELGTVTVNLGIDIGTPSGSAIHAAEEGTVSVISSLPSYGTIVIVNHSGGVHTVYADLAGVSVSRGQKVTRGTPIGRSGSNAELGNILHFEVWKGRTKQNPMRWLK